ncbi:SH3 domain-containing kinase-binding protein 1, partial [Trichinella pseudospiralis]
LNSHNNIFSAKMEKVAGDASLCSPKVGNVASLVRRISSELKSKSNAPSDHCRKSVSDFRGRRLRVVQSYTPVNEDELRLEVNDLVEMIGDEEDGWYKARLNGKTGMVPASHVKPLDVLSSQIRHHDHSIDHSNLASDSSDTSVSEIQPKKIHGVGFGNIFAANDGKFGLKSTKYVAGMAETKRPLDTKDDQQQPKSPIAVKKPVEEQTDNLNKVYVKANYGYEAENDDELTLQVGDIVTVLKKDCEDPGWWYGELNGKKGVFPDNFVSPISAEEAMKKWTPPIVPVKPAKPNALTTSSGSSATTDVGSSGAKLAKGANLIDHSSGRLIIAGKSQQIAPSEESVKIKKDVKSETPTGMLEKHDKGGVFRLSLLSKSKVAKNTESDVTPVKTELDGHKIEIAERGGDSVETPSAKISQLITSRPKMNNKRLPSSAFVQGMVESACLLPAATAVQSTVKTGNVVKKGGSDGQLENGSVKDELHALQTAFTEFSTKLMDRIEQLEKRIVRLENSANIK